MTNETMILSGFLDQLGALLHRKLVAIEQLRARHGISYKVEASGRSMLLKLVDATSTDVTTRQRKNSFEQQLQCIIDGHMRSFAQANAVPFPELQHVLEWCLEIDKDRRYPTFAAALNAFENILHTLR